MKKLREFELVWDSIASVFKTYGSTGSLFHKEVISVRELTSDDTLHGGKILVTGNKAVVGCCCGKDITFYTTGQYEKGRQSMKKEICEWLESDECTSLSKYLGIEPNILKDEIEKVFK